MTVSAVSSSPALLPLDPAEQAIVATERSDALDAPALAVAVVPAELTITMLGDADTQGGALLVVRQYGHAVALIELGDGYLLDIDRARASVLLSNAQTGLSTTIWGKDAAIALEGGGEPARFWGNVTFALDNGAVITAATVQNEANPLLYMLDSLTVTKREAAVVIANVATVAAEALEVVASEDGWVVEYDTPDGMVLEQDATGAGWTREWSPVAADAAWLAETAPGEAQGPGTGMMSGREFGHFVSWMTTISTTRTLSQHIVPETSRDDGGRRAEDRAVLLKRLYLDSLRPSAELSRPSPPRA